MKYQNCVHSRISNLRDLRNPACRGTELSGAISALLVAKTTAEKMVMMS